MGNITDREYDSIIDSMKDINEEMKRLTGKVGNLSDRLLKIETVAQVAMWLVGTGGLTMIISGIIFIFKMLTKSE